MAERQVGVTKWGKTRNSNHPAYTVYHLSLTYPLIRVKLSHLLRHLHAVKGLAMSNSDYCHCLEVAIPSPGYGGMVCLAPSSRHQPFTVYSAVKNE